MQMSEGQILTYIANATIVDKQIVAQDTTNEKVVVGTATGKNIGVAQMDAVAGQSIPVQTSGIVKIIVGTTVVAGDIVSSDATGKAKPAATGDTILGTCVYGGAAGEVCSVQLTHANVK